MDIGTLTGAITLEDQASGVMSTVISNVKNFAKDMEGTLGVLAIGAGALTAAVGGAITSIGMLAQSGDELIGVERGFDNLARSIGQTGDVMLSSLMEGTKNTVDDLILMQNTTKLLASGMRLTADDMKLLGSTAREMGKATGTDAAQGLQELSMALTTGQTRLLRRHGILIDVKKAEEDYAEQLGVTREQLTQQEKIEGTRIAMLEGMRDRLGKLGESEVNFTERVQQSLVALDDWMDSLTKQVAMSPNVINAYDRISDAIVEAFGDDSQTMLENIVRWINNFADAVATYGPLIIKFFSDTYDVIKNLVSFVIDTYNAIPDWLKNLAFYVGVATAAIWAFNAAVGFLMGLKIVTFFGALGTAATGAAVGLGAFARAAVLTYQLGGVTAVLAGIGTALSGLMTAFTAAAAGAGVLGTAMVVALAGVATAIRDLYRAWQEGKSMWDFFFTKRSEEELDWLSKGVRGVIRGLGGDAILSARQVDELDASLKKLQYGPALPKEFKPFIGPRLEDVIQGPRTGPDIIEGMGLPPVRELSDDAKAAQKAYQDLASELGGKKAFKELKDLEKAWKDLSKGESDNVNLIKDVLTRYDDLRKVVGTSVSPALEKLYMDNRRLIGGQQEATVVVQDWKGATAAALNAVAIAHDTWSDTVTVNLDTVTQRQAMFAEGLSHVRDVMAQVEEQAAKSTLGQRLLTGVTAGLQESAEAIPQIVIDGIIHGAKWSDIGLAIGTEIGSTIGKSVGTALGTALGGPLGGKIGGAIGEAAGALVGPLADALHRSAGEDVVRRVGHEWGIAITEEMSDAIAEQAKIMFRGSRAAAETFNLGELLDVAGGLNADNLDTFTHKLRDTFTYLSQGIYTSSQATEVLNENFGEFVDYFKGGLISTELREIIALTQREGLEVEAITDYLQEQAQRARTGLAGILSGSLRYSMEGGEETEFVTARAGQGIVSQEQFDRFTRLATVSFQAALAAGEPFLDVLAEMKDQFSLLGDTATTFGFQQSAAFGDLSALSAFFSENEALGESIQGTNEMLQALANSNFMTQQTFADLGAIAVENFNAMIDGGLTFDQALMAQQDTLQTLWELMQEGTYVVDDATQALIDQAIEAGAVGESHMDAQERATAAMERTAMAMEKLTDTLATAFGIAETTSQDFFDTTIESIEELPRRIEFEYVGVYVPPEVPAGGEAPDHEMAFGGAGIATEPTIFKAGEAGPEPFWFGGGGAEFPGQGELLDEIRLLRGDMKTMQRAQARIMRDELLTAPRR